MDFLEDPPFPSCPSFGFTSEPMYRVTIIQTAGGHERRNRHWARPLHRYTASVAPRNQKDVADLLEFYHAVGGRAFGFRFKDWVDYKSCHVDAETSMLDQSIIETEDAGVYQLYKVYTAGALSQTREIVKPISGTIRVADNGMEKLETTDWDLDYTTGLITLNFSPTGSLTWGGEFHVAARFDSELPVEILNKEIHGTQFTLMELRLNELGSES